jgi:outer membrane protein assembly factor BamB
MRNFLARRRLLVAACVCVMLVAACGPAPLGTGWPAISLVESVCGEEARQGIIVSYNDRIVIVNPANGQTLQLLNQDCEPRPPDQDGKAKTWDFRVTGAQRQFFSNPQRLDEQTLLALSYDQRFFHLDLAAARTADGTEGIAIDGRSGHTVADMLVTDDTIYVGLSAKDLVALERDTFDVLWTAPTEHGVWAKPLLVENTLYFTSLDHFLYAVNAESGDLLWKLDVGGAATSTPLLYEDHLFLGTFGRKIFEITLEGEIINEYATVEWVWGTPVILNDILYAADLGGNVYALDTNNNLSEIWRQAVATRAIRHTPLVVDNVIIVASRDQKIYWLNRSNGSPVQDADGNPLVREVGGEILSDVMLITPGPSVDIEEPYIVVGTLTPGQLLLAYTLDNGENKWSYALP